jgi:deoxyribonuclease V
MDLDRLARLQLKMAKKVVLKDDFSKPRRIAGVDVAYELDYAFAAAAVLRFKDMTPLEIKIQSTRVSFPYIPGYLSFREAEPMKLALRALESDYDLLFVNGHGIAHPRGLGIASHIGVELSVPTVGVAKGLLCGEVKKGNLERTMPIIYKDRRVGFKIFPGKKGGAIYISPGNMITLSSSLKIVKACMKGHALPEPLYMAHHKATRAKKKSMLSNEEPS